MKSIVIIDDQVEMTQLLEKFFSRFKDTAIKTFNDSQHALLYLKSTKADLIISDITMPKLDGIELLKSLKEARPDAKVMMMSAEATLERVLKSHKYDASDFIIKPINLIELEKCLKKYIIV
jgi:DNA-binding NtrC family response regulator